jgi:hypothetical protein
MTQASGEGGSLVQGPLPSVPVVLHIVFPHAHSSEIFKLWRVTYYEQSCIIVR